MSATNMLFIQTCLVVSVLAMSTTSLSQTQSSVSDSSRTLDDSSSIQAADLENMKSENSVLPLSVAAPTNRVQFCQLWSQPQMFVQLAFRSENQLSFRNKGGYDNAGVCWWHALFTRNALYLTHFAPHLPKPTKKQAKALVHALAVGKNVVEIPGYSNLRDFSKDFEPVIQRKLEQWQLVDGVLKWAWLRGLQGKTSLAPDKLEIVMNDLFAAVVDLRKVQWTMLQIRGIATHGVLWLNLIKNDKGMDTAVIDNNFVGEIRNFPYVNGARSLETRYGKVVPYLGRQSDLQKFEIAADQYCTNQMEPITGANAVMLESEELDNRLD